MATIKLNENELKQIIKESIEEISSYLAGQVQGRRDKDADYSQIGPSRNGPTNMTSVDNQIADRKRQSASRITNATKERNRINNLNAIAGHDDGEQDLIDYRGQFRNDPQSLDLYQLNKMKQMHNSIEQNDADYERGYNRGIKGKPLDMGSKKKAQDILNNIMAKLRK